MPLVGEYVKVLARCLLDRMITLDRSAGVPVDSYLGIDLRLGS